jgi:hypothetical protein
VKLRSRLIFLPNGTAMRARASAEANFFASLVSPSEVIAACEQSAALNALARQKHSADRPGRKRSSELATWDAAVDEGQTEAESRKPNLVGSTAAAARDERRVEVVLA